MDRPLITIGLDKNGHYDFGVSCELASLSLKELNELRQIIPSAIWCAEDMWKRYNQDNGSKENTTVLYEETIEDKL